MATRPISRTIKNPTHAQANAEVLLWQSSIRFALMLLVAAVIALLMATHVLPGITAVGVISIGIYAATTIVSTEIVRRRGDAPEWLVAWMVTADIVFVFGTTYLVMAPRYYDRALLVGFAILHFTESYFGRRLAWSALAAIMVCYVAIIAAALGGGAMLSWPQELCSLLVFGVAASLFIIHYGNFKRRLAAITWLFERVADGDFSDEYDLSADLHPDSITMVGRAYNRVRSQLADLVLTDALSGCQNRRGLEQHLRREIARAARARAEVALVALDVDNFKLVNDTFGHLAGDAVIQELGTLLRDVARTTDVVARTGGDEFWLLLPETNIAGAFRVATRIREEVAARHFQGLAGKMMVTVSIGLVADQVTDENVSHDLRSRADEALYAAKDGGRNRVSIWTPNLRAFAVTRAGQQLLSGT